MCEKNLEYFCAIFGAMEFEKWNLCKNPQNESIWKPRTSFICNSNSVENLVLLIKTKL